MRERTERKRERENDQNKRWRHTGQEPVTRPKHATSKENICIVVPLSSAIDCVAGPSLIATAKIHSKPYNN